MPDPATGAPSQDVGRRQAGGRADGQVWHQNRQVHRKVMLRRQLLALAGNPPGAAFVPFCGDGVLAEACYPNRNLLAADIDPARVAAFEARVKRILLRETLWCHAVVADCDRWPFTDPNAAKVAVAVADCDAYAWPYDAWRAFTARGRLASTVVAVFTDSQQNTMQRNGLWRLPDGTPMSARLDERGQQRRLVDSSITVPEYRMWWRNRVQPWAVAEARRLNRRLIATRFYKVKNTLYWGMVLGPTTRGV